MSEKLYGVDQFYPGDFAPILTGVYTRRDNVYLYEVTSYRDNVTGKVRQRFRYMVKEVIRENVAYVRELRSKGHCP